MRSCPALHTSGETGGEREMMGVGCRERDRQTDTHTYRSAERRRQGDQEEGRDGERHTHGHAE